MLLGLRIAVLPFPFPRHSPITPAQDYLQNGHWSIIVHQYLWLLPDNAIGVCIRYHPAAQISLVQVWPLNDVRVSQ